MHLSNEAAHAESIYLALNIVTTRQDTGRLVFQQTHNEIEIRVLDKLDDPRVTEMYPSPVGFALRKLFSFIDVEPQTRQE